VTIKYATKCVVKYKGYIINRTMYRPTVYKTKLNEIIVNSNEPIKAQLGVRLRHTDRQKKRLAVVEMF
jgi:hypothetical protein